MNFSRLSTFLLFLSFYGFCSTPQTKPSLARINDLDMQGHRGARGLFPENTLPAFKAAMEMGMTTIELDTVLTKDKQLIIHHDNRLNAQLCKWLNGANVDLLPIKNFTVEELKELDCGSLKNSNFPHQTLVPGTKLSTLKEFFIFVKEYEKTQKPSRLVSFNIETKIDVGNYSDKDILEYAQVIVRTIEEAKLANRATVQSFVLEVLPEIKKLNSEIKTSALFAPSKAEYLLLILRFFGPRKSIIEKAKEFKADIISPFHEYVNSEFTQLCHESKLKVIPWTVNDKVLMRKMLLYGVDGIISDYPDKLKSMHLED